MAKNKQRTVFACQKCGAQRPRWEGRCSDCGSWNTFVEEREGEPSPGSSRGWISRPKSAGVGGALSLNQDVEAESIVRWSTGLEELDRVLGGGIVPGSFILVGGDPGIGKSTLLMQMAGGVASQSKKTLYVTAEESVKQTALRAQRLGVRSERVQVFAESNLNEILAEVESAKPDVVIVDSIQTIFRPDLESAPGTVSQVRECAGQLMTFAKSKDVSIFLVGHVTKDGAIAGPKVLEHMVDTVLSFEGDHSHQFRLLRAMKNRFGATFELGVFQMSSDGLQEVKNPSELFLEERGKNSHGSAVFASMEGSRPLLCEIQALTVVTQNPMPRRTAIGTDLNRLHLLSAVLEKHGKLSLSHADIFVSAVGGLKLTEPAADLAIAAALLSTHRSIALDPKAVFFGEVGLTGEIRAVSFAESRLREAKKLGFQRFVIPAANRKHVEGLIKEWNAEIEFQFVSHLTHVSDMIAGAPRKTSVRTVLDLD